MSDQNHQIAAQSAAKIVHPWNANVMEMKDVAYTFRPGTRDITPSIKLDLLLGVFMIATAPEFKGTGDPRPEMIDAETATHIEKILKANGVLIERSIAIALDRPEASAA